MLKRRFLDRELAWAEFEKRENAVKALEANRVKHQDSLGKIEKEKQAYNDQLSEQQSGVASLKGQEKTVFIERIRLERGIAEKESKSISLVNCLRKPKFLRT